MNESQISRTLLVCDMDGTLLNSRCKVSSENKAALERFVAAGGKFTVATGRMEASVIQYLKDLPVNLPAILYNGAAICDLHSKKVFWQECLNEQVNHIISELLVRFPEVGVEVFCNGQVYFLQDNEETDRHRLKEGFCPHRVSLEDIPKPWYKVLLAWKPERLEEVDEFLTTKKGSFRTVYSEPQFLEILSNSASKGNALKQLIAVTGIQCSRVVAMGDNMNDFEMIECADIGIAVGNAHPHLKKAADFCCCHHDEHAVAQVVSLLEENRI